MALPDDRESRPTTADDLHELLGCWTRLEVLIALSGRPRPIGIVTQALGLRRPLVHLHTRTLERLGLVRGERTGIHIQFSLSHRVSIRTKAGTAARPGVEIKAAADDGAKLNLFLPRDSPVMRLIAAGLWARDHDEPERFTPVRQPGPVLLPMRREG